MESGMVTLLEFVTLLFVGVCITIHENNNKHIQIIMEINRQAVCPICALRKSFLRHLERDTTYKHSRSLPLCMHLHELAPFLDYRLDNLLPFLPFELPALCTSEDEYFLMISTT